LGVKVIVFISFFDLLTFSLSSGSARGFDLASSGSGSARGFDLASSGSGSASGFDLASSGFGCYLGSRVCVKVGSATVFMKQAKNYPYKKHNAN
jgi:hypothetical protein